MSYFSFYGSIISVIIILVSLSPCTSFLMKGNAVQIYKCERGTCRLNTHITRAVFGKVENKPVAIYSISGKYRSGKSFLLSILLKYLLFGEKENWMDIPTSDLFKYQNSEERVTTGLWIWSEPIIRKTRDGKEVALFLMDTQGWHDEYTGAYETELAFSLSVLMSSFVILNAEKRIGEDDLHFFNSFSSYAKLFEKENNDQPLQRLMFVIRDWQFTSNFSHGYYDDVSSIDGKNYKTSKFDLSVDQDIDAKAIRELIKDSYNNISAYLMPYPGAGVFDNKIESKTWGPLFVEYLEGLAYILFEKQEIEAKRIGGKLITGRKMIEFMEIWKTNFEQDITIVRSRLTDEKPYQLAYQTALDYFDAKFKETFKKCIHIEDNDNKFIEMKRLSFKLRGWAELSKQVFISRKLKSEHLNGKYLDKLSDELDERIQFYQRILDMRDMKNHSLDLNLVNDFVLEVRRERKLTWFESILGKIKDFFKAIYKKFQEYFEMIFKKKTR